MAKLNSKGICAKRLRQLERDFTAPVARAAMRAHLDAFARQEAPKLKQMAKLRRELRALRGE